MVHSEKNIFSLYPYMCRYSFLWQEDVFVYYLYNFKKLRRIAPFANISERLLYARNCSRYFHRSYLTDLWKPAHNNLTVPLFQKKKLMLEKFTCLKFHSIDMLRAGIWIWLASTCYTGNHFTMHRILWPKKAI